MTHKCNVLDRIATTTHTRAHSVCVWIRRKKNIKSEEQFGTKKNLFLGTFLALKTFSVDRSAIFLTLSVFSNRIAYDYNNNLCEPICKNDRTEIFNGNERLLHVVVLAKLIRRIGPAILIITWLFHGKSNGNIKKKTK